MPVGLYQADSTGHWIYSNDRYAEMTGLTLEQSDQEGWLESVHAEDREMVREVWRSARAAGSEFRIEYRLADASGGQPQWVIADETPTREGGYIGTITDITGMKRALSAVAEGAERFQMLANNISPFCWMADATGRIFWYNDRWYEYTGTTFEELQGSGWRTVHHPDHVDRVVEKLNAALAIRRGMGRHLPVARQERQLSLVSVTGLADSRRVRQDHALVRHQ